MELNLLEKDYYNKKDCRICTHSPLINVKMMFFVSIITVIMKPFYLILLQNNHISNLSYYFSKIMEDIKNFIEMKSRIRSNNPNYITGRSMSELR